MHPLKKFVYYTCQVLVIPIVIPYAIADKGIPDYINNFLNWFIKDEMQ